MGRFLLICLGGAIGTGARFLVSSAMVRAFGPEFPRGTLIVNLTGSFLIGLIMELSLRTGAVSPGLRLFLTAGVMGGYTTYSSFNYETLRLAEDGSYRLATLYLGLTLVGCLVAGTLGVLTARTLAGASR